MLICGGGSTGMQAFVRASRGSEGLFITKQVVVRTTSGYDHVLNSNI